MRFLFCGDSNCPEWFLAESALLTKIASIKMKLVTQYILQNIVEGVDTAAKIFKMLEGSGFTQQEINSTISCVTFIVENSAKYDVSEQTLIKELIDLGLPKENCEQLSKTFKQFKEKLQQTYESQIVRIGQAVEFHYGISKFIVSESVAPQKQIDGNRFIDSNITYKDINGQQQSCQFVIFPEQLEDMLISLKKAQKIMINSISDKFFQKDNPEWNSKLGDYQGHKRAKEVLSLIEEHCKFHDIKHSDINLSIISSPINEQQETARTIKYYIQDTDFKFKTQNDKIYIQYELGDYRYPYPISKEEVESSDYKKDSFIDEKQFAKLLYEKDTNESECKRIVEFINQLSYKQEKSKKPQCEIYIVVTHKFAFEIIVDIFEGQEKTKNAGLIALKQFHEEQAMQIKHVGEIFKNE